MDGVFRACVVLLEKLAALFGMSYVQINIWIFVIIWPLLFILMAVTIFVLAVVISRQRRALDRMREMRDKRQADS